MIHTFVTFYVLAGKHKEFERVHQQLLGLISAQSGCNSIQVYKSVANRDDYVVHGIWESKRAWEWAHQSPPEFKTLFARLPIAQHSLSRASFFEPAYHF